MKRKGQLLTMDALLSLVIVVMVVGVVMNTNDMIKAEITNLLDWYDRANIANNMLDVLTKSPGYPENWEEDVSSVRMVGLRDNDYPFALDYEKILALNRSKEDVTSILNQLVRGKDFLFEVYVSKFNLSVSGSLNSSYTSARDLLGAGETLYWFSLINGTFVDDINLIKSSMASSPWIEPVERTIVFPKFAYNLSSGPSAEEPLIYGFMRYNPLEGTSIRIRVNSTNYGNLTLLSKLGTEIRALFVYGNSTDLNATLVWYENGNATLKAYEGVNGTVTMSFEELFGSSDTTNKLIGLWLYSLEGWNRSDVTIEVVPTIEYMLEPKFEYVITKLWVWDDG
ncbi:MAG: hypothetical protein PWP49_193 [Thermococcaceae archaeon]|nr:hypothetical protein [Thermococcaceae archaeon]